MTRVGWRGRQFAEAAAAELARHTRPRQKAAAKGARAWSGPRIWRAAGPLALKAGSLAGSGLWRSLCGWRCWRELRSTGNGSAAANKRGAQRGKARLALQPAPALVLLLLLRVCLCV